MAHLELYDLGRWVWPWQLIGNDLWPEPITSILFTNCWQAQPLTVKWVGMISVTPCHSNCKSSCRQEKPKSRNGKGRSWQVQHRWGCPHRRSEKWNKDSSIHWASSESMHQYCPWTIPEDLKGNTRRKAKASRSERTGFKSQLYHLINGLELVT